MDYSAEWHKVKICESLVPQSTSFKRTFYRNKLVCQHLKLKDTGSKYSIAVFSWALNSHCCDCDCVAGLLLERIAYRNSLSLPIRHNPITIKIRFSESAWQQHLSTQSQLNASADVRKTGGVFFTLSPLTVLLLPFICSTESLFLSWMKRPNRFQWHNYTRLFWQTWSLGDGDLNQTCNKASRRIKKNFILKSTFHIFFYLSFDWFRAGHLLKYCLKQCFSVHDIS